MGHAYLDYNATTPVDPAVLEAMLPYFREQFGNPSSRHEFGTAARRAVDGAREQVAAAVGVQPAQVVFTSGGSEANNLFLRGAAAFLKPSQVVVSAVEHPCVLRPAQDLARAGWRLRKLGVDGEGLIAAADLEAALAEPAGIVSVMLANNETGVLQDIPGIAARARAAGALVHTDAVQALGKVPVDFAALRVHALTLSSHKLCGPKGAGALVFDKRVSLKAQIAGGSHENGLRAGTENVPAIVGFGLACERAVARLEEAAARMAALRTQLEAGLSGLGARIFGAGAPRLPNTSYFAFEGIEGETLVVELDRRGFAVASGAACSSGRTGPSHVLEAMGIDPVLGRGAVRASVGRETAPEEVRGLLEALGAAVCGLRGLSAIAL